MKTFEEYLSEIGGLSYEYNDKYRVTSPKDFEVESGWYPLLYDLKCSILILQSAAHTPSSTTFCMIPNHPL